ncbi:hypothetical protein NOVA_28890 [Nocardia nova]|uniref:hypothetical protein n=1 Tax=Nocardia nova TaxID=37330 RepID=UPI001C4529D2|nr:hypothetical protein [Nocardia nova]MBV7706809.1 hypothetical protein [Nocardia nova]
MFTAETATKYVIGSIESAGSARAEEFDVDGIVATLHAYTEDWDFDGIDRATFWSIVASHLR